MRPYWFLSAGLVGLAVGGAQASDDSKVKFSDCPEAVRTTLQGEAAGAKIEVVTKEKDEDDDVVYWADVVVAGKTYAVGVLEDGTLSEMNLAVDGDDEIPLEKASAAAKATFQAEGFGLKIVTVAKDLKYGVTIYEAVVEHKGKSYQIVVAEDGTLVEKVLVIDEEEVEISACPPLVQAALKKHAKGGKIDAITRSNGIGKRTFEAEVESKGKVYLIEIDEAGVLISKSLQASQE